MFGYRLAFAAVCLVLGNFFSFGFIEKTKCRRHTGRFQNDYYRR